MPPYSMGAIASLAEIAIVGVAPMLVISLGRSYGDVFSLPRATQAVFGPQPRVDTA